MRIPKGDETKQGPVEIFQIFQINMKPQSTDAESSESTKKINDKNKTIPLHLGMSHSNYRKIKDKGNIQKNPETKHILPLKD